MEVWEEIAADANVGARRLVAEYGDRLYGASVALCHDVHAAEDLVFRTFERAIERVAAYDPKYAFYNWLYTIMLNFFRTDCRKKKAIVAEEDSWVQEHVPATNCDTDSACEKISAEDLRSAVDRLSPVLRETVVLHYYDDMSIDEMAKVMSAPAGTVKWRLNKARKMLKRMLCGPLAVAHGEEVS